MAAATRSAPLFSRCAVPVMAAGRTRRSCRPPIAESPIRLGATSRSPELTSSSAPSSWSQQPHRRSSEWLMPDPGATTTASAVWARTTSSRSSVPCQTVRSSHACAWSVGSSGSWPCRQIATGRTSARPELVARRASCSRWWSARGVADQHHAAHQRAGPGAGRSGGARPRPPAPARRPGSPSERPGARSRATAPERSRRRSTRTAQPARRLGARSWAARRWEIR